MESNGMPVTIHMKTTIQLDQEKDTSVISTEGQLFQKGFKTFVRFQEPVDQKKGLSSQVTMQTMKIQQGEMTVSRKGAVSMNQRFIPGASTEGMYHSPHGVMAMETKTKGFQFLKDELTGAWKLRLRYTLQLQGANAGDFDIRMTIKEVLERS